MKWIFYETDFKMSNTGIQEKGFLKEQTFSERGCQLSFVRNSMRELFTPQGL